MAVSKRQQLDLIAELMKVHDPALQRAFLDAINEARSSISLSDVIAALRRGDIAEAARAAEVSKTFFAPFDMELQRAYFNSGSSILNQFVADGRRNGTTVNVRFDAGDPRAAEWMRRHSSTLITAITEDQRTATREALAVGMEAGRHPRTVALDVVGRINPTTKKREGGVIGLTRDQTRYLESARKELRDPEAMANYLKRKLRDRRFDSIVRRAIKEGRPLANADVARITTRYSDRMLKARAETIARTESLTALSYGQDEAARQLLDASGLRADQIVRTWVSHIDRRTRDGHIALHEKKTRLDSFFISPMSGAHMRFPRDTEMGAHGIDVINCRCTSTLKVNWKGASSGL